MVRVGYEHVKEFIRYPEDYTTEMGCFGANLCFLASERPTRSAYLLDTCGVRCCPHEM